jgi:hypothetical protein
VERGIGIKEIEMTIAIRVNCMDHPYADCRGTVLRARLVMEKYLLRYLDSFEIIHHIDEDNLNDVIENLELCCRSSHITYHTVKREWSEESRRKASISQMGKKKGKHTEETKRKIGLSHKGMKYKKWSEESRRNFSIVRMGIKPSEETRLKLSEIRKLWWENKKGSNK